MHEKKSLQMVELKKEVKRITLAQIFILFVTLIVCKNQMQNKIGDFIKQKYALKTLNTTEPVNFSIDLIKTFKKKDSDLKFLDDMENMDIPMFDYEDEELPLPDFKEEEEFWKHANETEEDPLFFSAPEGVFSNQNETQPVTESIYEPMQLNSSVPTIVTEEPRTIRSPPTKPGRKTHNGWGKHHKGMYTKPQFDVDNMTCEQAVEMSNYIIGIILVFCFIYITILICIQQSIFICVINKIKMHQERLERNFFEQPSQNYRVAQPV